MKLTGNPFSKYSYGDKATKRNKWEVAACAIVAQELGVKCVVGKASAHACFIEVAARMQPKIRQLVTSVSMKAAREAAEALWLGQ